VQAECRGELDVVMASSLIAVVQAGLWLEMAVRECDSCCVPPKMECARNLPYWVFDRLCGPAIIVGEPTNFVCTNLQRR
jgi:hypothetical protein